MTLPLPDRDTLKLLRIPFSLFLMPVFVFALAMSESIDGWAALWMFLALHLCIYPASNGYNSYIDRDEGPIGGLEKPPPPTKALFYTTLFLDMVGLGLVLLTGWLPFVLVLAYILASRAYSSPQLRLKKYPWIGFLTVMVFQGAVTFAMTYLAVAPNALANLETHWAAMLGASLLIAGVYPLTQVYQHEADRESGDRTISLVLGIRGTFLFSGAMFALAVSFVFLEFQRAFLVNEFLVFLLFLLPALVYFHWWAWQAWKDPAQANFKNTMRMNTIASVCMNFAFSTILILQI